mmetsp:Transcript_18739/g.59736  ORF Transcript_18739/g.59736 Transcript_18739/m.59736 type:complete len:207 (+) Transcript_18739:611-1231(+)
MRWISFSMLRVSACPTSGSSAACVSFSSSVFFSHSITCRSTSTISSSILSFSRTSASSCESSPRESRSSSLSSSMNSCSDAKLAFSSRACSSLLRAISWFRRVMSPCMPWMLFCRSTTSRLAASMARSVRSRFWSSTVRSDPSSPTTSLSFSAFLDTATSSVCRRSHCCCSSWFCRSSVPICLLRLLIVASRGPVLMSSLSAVSIS